MCSSAGGSSMTVARLQHIRSIGVNEVGDRADAANDPEMLRLENLDTDVAPPAIAVEVTRRVVSDDASNSYLPLEGPPRTASGGRGSRVPPQRRFLRSGPRMRQRGGRLNGVLNTLLAVVEPGQEVVITDPVAVSR